MSVFILPSRGTRDAGSLPQAEQRLELHTVGVEELLDGEPVGHGDHQGGETAEARVGLGAGASHAAGVEVAIPVVQTRDPRAELLVEEHVREDREEVAKGGAVVHELAVAGDQGVHALLPRRRDHQSEKPVLYQIFWVPFLARFSHFLVLGSRSIRARTSSATCLILAF